MPCKCSTKSKCCSRLCSCKAAKQPCIQECACLKGMCANMILVQAAVKSQTQAVCTSVMGIAAKWCKCGCCKETQSQSKLEKCCCRKLPGPCVLQDDDTQTVVLNAAVVRASINSQRLLMAQSIYTGYENRSMRHQAYSQYIAHNVGATGAGKRIVMPACVVSAIQMKWPAPDGQYTGFKMSTLSGHREFSFTVDGGREPIEIDDDENDA